MTPMDELNSPKALVCRSEHCYEQGKVIVWKVLLADGYLIDCGTDSISEKRAKLLARIINEAQPERFTRQALKETSEHRSKDDELG